MRRSLSAVLTICHAAVLTGALAALLSAPGAWGDGPAQACPNPSFGEGLAYWRISPASASVRVVRASGRETGRAAVEMDARWSSHEAGIISDTFAVEPLTPYRLGGQVKRIAGDGRYKISLEWLDADGNHLGYENSWTGVLLGREWEHHAVEVVSPEAARAARILAGVEPGCAGMMTRFELTPLPERGANLSIDIFPEPTPAGGEGGAGGAGLGIRIENRGAARVESATVEIELPAGLRSIDDLVFPTGKLSYGDAFVTRLPLLGAPENPEAPIRCTVRARADGAVRTFDQLTRPFVTAAEEIETATADLWPPIAPATEFRLGCYYFPVMLDWDRAGLGVRRAEHFEPLLGYYDEASPEVADWHIHWAVEHGISFFVFDWYYNQGMLYLNDALERGFLRSRFADRMQFCVDWCNEGQCTEFKPLDFSHDSLAGFMRTLCERCFRYPNYLRVEGKPVVLIHVPARIANAHGGWNGCRAALDRMREIAREYGHPGVYFVAVQNNPWLLDYAAGGFDCVTAYTYGSCDVPLDFATASLPYGALMPRHRECFALARERAHDQGLDYIPCAWIGWDDAGRSGDRAVRTAGNTPAAFRRMLDMLPRFVDRRPGLALFEAWNEWGEGGAAEPGLQYGFGYLNAVRDALTMGRGPHRVPIPSQTDRQRFATAVTFEHVNDRYYRRYSAELGLRRGLAMDFESVHDLWLRPGNDVAGIRIERGRLRGRSTGNDPILLGPPTMGLPAQHAQRVVLRMNVSAGRQGQLFWTTGGDRAWSEGHSVRFDVIADGRMHEYVLDVANHPRWSGTIRQFRFDPTDAPAEIGIDYFGTIPFANADDPAKKPRGDGRREASP
ncbi:MAG: glycoside hydrolase family 99-like domain-containing protein [Armatimonadota bacterium]|nr:MAG: glycoside hydrolase family 99-like domain-containing protein [Armatimonadota bacterium]